MRSVPLEKKKKKKVMIHFKQNKSNKSHDWSNTDKLKLWLLICNNSPFVEFDVTAECNRKEAFSGGYILYPFIKGIFSDSIGKKV